MAVLVHCGAVRRGRFHIAILLMRAVVTLDIDKPILLEEPNHVLRCQRHSHPLLCLDYTSYDVLRQILPKNGQQNKKETSNFLCIKVLSGGAFVV